MCSGGGIKGYVGAYSADLFASNNFHEDAIPQPLAPVNRFYGMSLTGHHAHGDALLQLSIFCADGDVEKMGGQAIP